ncbi:MAG: AAA family ATPase, partial [Clostridia bacterium]|nr:AAA family ATPase [Clostridia bacterium]
MLLQLAIQNLALIDQMEIQFLPGMNVLTGETGAGKSIVVDAVNLVLGERAGKHMIAEGQSKAVVEAVFDIEGNDAVKSILDQMELGTDEPIVSISRQITENGRNI